MVKAYLNAEDLRMRLHDCLVFYKGEPYIVSCDEINFPDIALKTLVRKVHAHTVDHRDVYLDTGTPNLGYMNYNGETYYISRMPNKRQHQAVKIDNLSVSPNRPNVRNWGHTRAFYNCLMGDYPRPNTALQGVLGGLVRSMAISRDFAISSQSQQKIALMYKDREVGYYDPSTLKVSIVPTPESSWIKNLIIKEGLVNEPN